MHHIHIHHAHNEIRRLKSEVAALREKADGLEAENRRLNRTLRSSEASPVEAGLKSLAGELHLDGLATRAAGMVGSLPGGLHWTQFAPFAAQVAAALVAGGHGAALDAMCRRHEVASLFHHAEPEEWCFLPEVAASVANVVACRLVEGLPELLCHDVCNEARWRGFVAAAAALGIEPDAGFLDRVLRRIYGSVPGVWE